MPGLAPPRQARSARTLSAVLAAAERLLARHNPQEVSIADICRESGVTTGAFYARFRDRNALFDLLESQVLEAFDAMGRQVFDGRPDASETLASLLTVAVRRIAGLYSTHRGVIRGLNLRALDDADLASRLGRFNKRLVARAAERLAAHRREIRHPRPREASRQVVTWLVTILRQDILFGELALRGRPAGGTRLDDLVHLALAYLSYEAAP